MVFYLRWKTLCQSFLSFLLTIFSLTFGKIFMAYSCGRIVRNPNHPFQLIILNLELAQIWKIPIVMLISAFSPALDFLFVCLYKSRISLLALNPSWEHQELLAITPDSCGSRHPSCHSGLVAHHSSSSRNQLSHLH